MEVYEVWIKVCCRSFLPFWLLYTAWTLLQGVSRGQKQQGECSMQKPDGEHGDRRVTRTPIICVLFRSREYRYCLPSSCTDAASHADTPRWVVGLEGEEQRLWNRWEHSNVTIVVSTLMQGLYEEEYTVNVSHLLNCDRLWKLRLISWHHSFRRFNCPTYIHEKETFALFEYILYLHF